MMNWIYTWYKPRVDGGCRRTGPEMGDIFLRGVSGAEAAMKVGEDQTRT